MVETLISTNSGISKPLSQPDPNGTNLLGKKTRALIRSKVRSKISQLLFQIIKHEQGCAWVVGTDWW